MFDIFPALCKQRFVQYLGQLLDCGNSCKLCGKNAAGRIKERQLTADKVAAKTSPHFCYLYIYISLDDAVPEKVDVRL